MCKQNPFDGFNVITMYTRAQAIADGVLHDVTDTAKKCGFRIPVAITDTIWRKYIDVDDKPELKELGQSTEARLRDVLIVLYFGIRSFPGASQSRRLTFATKFLMDAGKELAYETPQMTSDIGPGDEGEPVITILIPEYDD